MSIVISSGHKETAEVEFRGRHPDIFCSYLAAALVKRLAIESDRVSALDRFRADLNVQLLGEKARDDGITPIRINVGGQLKIPEVALEEIVREEAIDLLQHGGYLDYTGDFARDALRIDVDGITPQSILLNGTTSHNRFADSCVVYGHYIAFPFGEQGTFPSLIIAQRIDQAVDHIRRRELPELRPDGKVHITIERHEDGYHVTDAYISVSHGKDADVNGRVASRIRELFSTLRSSTLDVDKGGKFDMYFVQADAGVSKAKDGVVVTGGIHQIGTDAVWGKCLYKASSIALPYAFALSRVVCEATGARFASVGVYAQYGGEARIQLQDVDPAFESQRKPINDALSRLPKTRDEIAALVGLETSIQSYQLFNDVGGFHGENKPWKRDNPELRERFKEHYAAHHAIIGGALK
ncbi:hypothetical protein HY497_01315 [Candidatus Woesearchaeota archaeon]|nr:hypothetical protein [Candidatus Woesearchaeota archaeon]